MSARAIEQSTRDLGHSPSWNGTCFTQPVSQSEREANELGGHGRLRREGRALLALLALLALGACKPSSPPAPTEETSAHLVLERFPSAKSGDTGVDAWDLAAIAEGGDTYVVARGYAIADGSRSARLEIVSRVGAAGASYVRGARPGDGDALVLDDRRAHAIAIDLEAMSTTLGKAAGAGGLRSKSLRIQADEPTCDGGDAGSLLSPCATQLLDCTATLSSAARTAGEIAQSLSGAAGSAVATSSPPASATLAQGGPSPDRTCMRSGGKLDLNDVSILFPLGGQRDQLLRTTQGVGSAALLPRTIFDRLPSPFVPGRGADGIYDALRVVAARIDPCFPGGTTDCKNQIRFVLQPIDGDMSLAADDSAVHVFYEISRASFTTLAQGLLALKNAPDALATDGPLRVHPALQSLGLSSPYGQRLKELLVSTSASGVLTRVTFIARGGDVGKENIWRFGAFDIEGGAPTAKAIPTLRRRSGSEVFEQMITINGTTKTLSATTSDPDGAALLPLLVPNGASDAEIAAAYSAAMRIEDPGLTPQPHTSENLDCVSCHLATPSRAWAAAQGRWTFPPMTFSSTLSLDNTTLSVMARSEVTRAFSYLSVTGSAPVAEISQRTINESAVVAEYINSHVLSP